MWLLVSTRCETPRYHAANSARVRITIGGQSNWNVAASSSSNGAALPSFRSTRYSQ